MITLPIVSTIPLKMAVQNTVEKKVKMLVTIFYMSNIVFFFLPFQALSSMLFANIFKLKESKMLLFGKEISSNILSAEYIIKCLPPPPPPLSKY